MSTEPDEAAARAPTEHAPADGARDVGHDSTLVAPDEDGRMRPRLDDDRLPATCGRYRVLGMLGSGGMGRVYEAIDDRLDRAVAVKVLHQHLNERHRQRLVREARALAKLSHPNVVHVYEVEEADGETFVAMELVRGQTLREWAQRDPRPDWRACVAVYLQAGAGLAAAHAEGLVHRDFKPGNAIIDDKGRVRVLDFGLAWLANELEPTVAAAEPEPELPDRGVEDFASDARLTTTGSVLGTPAYMSLEQMEGREVDARSDQLSFCISLYEAVYGERPFEGSVAALLLAMRAGRVRPAPKGTAVPAELRRVLLRGLATEPDSRWPSMEALLAALQRQIAPGTRRSLAVGLAAGLLAVGLGVGYYATRSAPSQTTPAALSTEAPAPTEPEAQAQVLYAAGKLAYRQGLFDEAVEKWSKAYELSEHPILLYDLSLALKQRYDISRNVEDLLRARSVMMNFLAVAEGDLDLDPADAKERIAELDAMIAELEPRVGEPAEQPAASPAKADG